MAIYLHETVDMISGQMNSYVKGLRDEAVPFLRQLKMNMCGFWQVNYSSGRWPEAVVVWEIGDWDIYTTQMETWKVDNAPREEGNTHYMNLAPKWRSGGFDRLLLPVSWSPKAPIYPTFKASGAVFFHQTFQLKPGKARDFLASMAKNTVPRLGEAGLTLEAFWRSVFNPFEYIGLFSAPGWAGYKRVQRTRVADDDGSQLPGLEHSWEFITHLQEKVLLAIDYSPWGGGVPTLGSAL